MLKEEESLHALELQLKALERERQDHARELAHRAKQVDSRRAQMQRDQGSAGVSSMLAAVSSWSHFWRDVVGSTFAQGSCCGAGGRLDI